jgi:hypothetical protein
MGKFCTSCGAALGEGVKFCVKCGTAVLAAPAEVVGAANEISPPQDFFGSKAAGKIKTKVKKETKDYAGKVFSNAVPAYGTAGEITLPQGLTPFPAIADGEGLFSVLRSGLSRLKGGFKRTLGDKKRLVMVIALVIIWLLVNVLASSGIFPLPVRLLSWLTAAQGSFIGGTIGKGLVAALLAQLVADQGMLQTVKSGLGQLGGKAKGLRGAAGPLLIGLGVALIAGNLMMSSHLQNTMVCLAAFLLSAKALTHHGFLRRLINALLPKAQNTTVTTLMRGWALGFALFAVISFLPGGGNGYVLGSMLLVIGVILVLVNKNKKEVTAE